MAKRKNKDPGAAPQVHQTRSFDQMVADATLARLGGYIDGQINELAQALLQRQQQSLGNILTRLVAAEEILTEKLGMTKDDLAERVATIQDRGEGFTAADDGVTEGDRVRVEIKTKTADQTEYQGSSRFMIDNVGSGQTLGKELEGALIGVKAGETREVLFGKDNSMQASLTVNRVSRQPKVEGTAEVKPGETLEQAEDRLVQELTDAPQEAINADVNAG